MIRRLSIIAVVIETICIVLLLGLLIVPREFILSNWSIKIERVR
jgi:hypothetical protein